MCVIYKCLDQWLCDTKLLCRPWAKVSWPTVISDFRQQSVHSEIEYLVSFSKLMSTFCVFAFSPIFVIWVYNLRIDCWIESDKNIYVSNLDIMKIARAYSFFSCSSTICWTRESLAEHMQWHLHFSLGLGCQDWEPFWSQTSASRNVVSTQDVSPALSIFGSRSRVVTEIRNCPCIQQCFHAVSSTSVTGIGGLQ